MTNGQHANTTGSQLEKAVPNVLSDKGFEVVMHSVWKKKRERYGKELLLKNVLFKTTSTYGIAVQ